MGRVEIYTDGACAHNSTWKGGWAFVAVFTQMPNEDTYISMGSVENTTNNAMELLAVLNALEFLAYDDEAKYLGDIKEKIIYTDSAYISNCFRDRWYDKWRKNGWLNSKKQPVANRDLWEKILTLYEFINEQSFMQLSIQKVKAHSGNKYNEMADAAAVEGTK